MIDLEPATRVLTAVVEGVGDEQLTAPTPCAGMSVGDLLDHIDGLALAFTAAATKELIDAGDQGPSPDGSRLGTDWRPRIAQRLAALTDAWRAAAAWTGMTRVGGVDLPGDVAGLVALDEVIVHGWDLATATGQRFRCDPDLAAAAIQFVEPTAMQNPEGTPGLFGPPLPVSADAPALRRLLGLTGRDVTWTA
jgi:uncharacterized protein (TIGR03086 family)